MQAMAITGGTVESLNEIPAHVWKDLPDYLNLGPSAVNQSRIGVWATRVIPKGKKLGPFVGEKKKRSQVTSNVYMWEVYFPTRGWMCIDATDPMKGNWLRYVNWARSSEEQNLFPLEINRAIHYKVLRPIGPGEELLVWYTVEDNPEITAALEEERASSLSRKNSARARRGEAFYFITMMTFKSFVSPLWQIRKLAGDCFAVEPNRGDLEEDEEEDEVEEEGEEEEEEDGDDVEDSESSSLAGREPEVDPDLDPDGDLEGDPQGEPYPCQHCERHFATRQGLERHIHIHAMSNQQAQLFKCRYCNKSFGSQVGRRRHERRHESGSKKRPGYLAGPASPVVQTDSSPDCTSPTTHYIATGSQFTGGQLHNSDMQRKELGPQVDRPFMLDENGESKELHPCKYCNKAFGTHTNMRRHQRRIHERHLLPKGVRRKAMLQQEAARQPDGSPSMSPPTVYVPSADTEDEADRDDYAVDISKNISENLSFYIDGKIVSTSAVSTCEVIEVDSRSAALFGLDTVILNPTQISQALKVETRTTNTKQTSNTGQPAAKRRTSTPPLIPSLKVETETSASSSSSSSTSSSSNLLVGGLFQQATDSSAFQREKNVYLSPKLKQLLQAQDIQKSTVTLITDSHKLASQLSVMPLQGSSGKFKRRTASPPSSSPQLSPASKNESGKVEVASLYTLKVPKLESQTASPSESLMDKDDRETLSPSGNATHNQPSSSSGGNSCNQQPLDLSNSVSKKSENLNKVLGDSALDLSFHRKTTGEPESKGNAAPQPLTKKRKPNTSMLAKVLMNEYAGLNLPGDEGPSTLANINSFPSHSPNVGSDSANPSPPSLTPMTMTPSSPGTSSVTSPTPPPPVLPTIPSPPAMPSSPLSQPSDSSLLRPLPVLSPKITPSPPEAESVDMPTTEDDVSQTGTSNSLPNAPSDSHDSSSSQASQSPHPITIKEEPEHCIDELLGTSHASPCGFDSSPQPTFVCNVCEKPFGSIKELSGHIVEHAADWPFKCEFCVQLFGDAPALLAHRTTLHGVGQIFVCSICSKEFAFLCNLQQHQKDLHPNEACSHTTVESGKLRPQNYTDPSRMADENAPPSDSHLLKEEPDVNGNHTEEGAEDPNEELYTTIKIMASEGGKPKGPDVRLGINQHYPSYKPPPFPYHSRSHAGSVASATNFTTHNIPQTFSTAIRCTKCGNSFDNMPELHQHILVCASASDKKRYTPKKNPIPLKQIVKSPNGVASPTAAAAGQSAFRRMGQPKRLNFNQDTGKTKMSALSKKKHELVQKAISQKNKTATNAKKAAIKVEEEHTSNVCPHCSRVFTYTASLTKHMAVSCPMKPVVVKKGKRGLAEVKKEPGSVADKNTSLRKKASDGEAHADTESKPLGKTRARSSGGADPERLQARKGKTPAAVGRPKRPASFPALVPASKRTKKGQVQYLPPTPSAVDTPSEASQRPAMRMQRMGKEAAPKRLTEAKSSSSSPPSTTQQQQQQQQVKKEERFSLRTRERVGGPVTRSLQMASTAPAAEPKTDEPPIQEPKDTQVSYLLAYCSHTDYHTDVIFICQVFEAIQITDQSLCCFCLFAPP
uniref:PR/SET domain 2 n=1 Tax=Maylandia zebra TaxID=106582 RepID=A0A3P9CAP4_9CICH